VLGYPSIRRTKIWPIEIPDLGCDHHRSGGGELDIPLTIQSTCARNAGRHSRGTARTVTPALATTEETRAWADVVAGLGPSVELGNGFDGGSQPEVCGSPRRRPTSFFGLAILAMRL
jgi:hypothetical protein